MGLYVRMFVELLEKVDDVIVRECEDRDAK